MAAVVVRFVRGGLDALGYLAQLPRVARAHELLAVVVEEHPVGGE